MRVAGRVGGSRQLGTDDARPVDFLLISASHCNLAEMVGEGTFREDLYYRLAGIELQLPPLRERTDRAEIIRNLLLDEGRNRYHDQPGGLRDQLPASSMASAI